MWRETLRTHWRGPLLSALGVTAVIWLGLTGRLSWYVHPRYIVFTVTMCVLAAIAIVAAAPALRAQSTRDPHADPASSQSPSRIGTVATVVLLLGAAVALLVVPPATLSAELAQQRQLGSDTLAVGSDSRAVEPGEETVKDWAMQLRQNGGTALEGEQASMLGFVLADPEGSPDTFLVARFSISCCAVDAQPVGVPVHSPDWQSSFAEGDWVTVEGMFIQNPDSTSTHQTVLRPTAIADAQEPSDPYVY